VRLFHSIEGGRASAISATVNWLDIKFVAEFDS
jgi:hypothetical protein